MVLNFVAQDSIAIASDSLESTVGKVWDLDSLGIKAFGEVHESFENDRSFIDGRYSVKLPLKTSLRTPSQQLCKKFVTHEGPN